MLNFDAPRNELTLAIARAAQGLPARPLRPVHAGMLIDADPAGTVILTAGDGDVTFTASCPAAVQSAGTALLPGRMLAEISRYFPAGEVSIGCTGKDLAEVTAGKTRFTLSASDGGQYPSGHKPPAVIGTVEGLSAGARKVIPAAGKSEPILDTVNLTVKGGRLYLVSTKRWVMGVMSLPLSAGHAGEGMTALVPAEVMERFARVAGDGEVSLGWDENLIAMGTPELQVISRLTARRNSKGEDLFVPWEKVLARMPQNWVSVSTAELARGVKMAQLATGSGDHDFTGLTFHNGLDITARGPGGTSSASLDCDYTVPEVTLSLSARYLLDGLGSCQDTAEFGFSGPGKTVFMRSGELIWCMQPKGER